MTLRPSERIADAAPAVVIPVSLSAIGQAALEHAAQGRRVFPCRRSNKAPLTPNGLDDATSDAETIVRWWTRWPDAMIGVRTGPEGDLWVLDVDVDEEKGINGFPALADLEAAHGSLPPTVRSRTPRGGMHYLFKWSDGVRNSAGRVAAGIDVRGAGGYAIVAPSVRADGAAYVWEDPPGLFELAESPAWLLVVVTKQPEAERPLPNGAALEPSRYAEVALAEECASVVRARNGTRNDALNRAAFSLGQLVVGGALDECRVRARLAEAGQDAGLRQDEIARTIDSGLRGGGEHPRAPENREASHRREEGGRRHYAPLDDAPKPKASGGFRLTLFRDIDPTPRKDWLVDDMFGEGELSVVYGVPGSGKSVLVGDAACHVAAGLPWLGKPVRRGAVLYVAAERSALVKRRMAAWKQRHGIEDLPLAVVDGVFNLSSSQEDVEQLVETVADLKAMTGQPVTWIFIDTKAQVMGGGDENAARDMMGFVSNLARLQAGAEHAQGWRPHVTVVDHVPHAEPH